MQNNTTSKAYRACGRFLMALGISTFVLALSTDYAQAGYSTATIVQPIPSTAARPAATRISGSHTKSSAIAYETPAGQPAPIVIQGAPAGANDSVEGFADQVPLNVAMQQVLPQGMGYSLSDGVNPGQLVSWRGGRPWQTVLQDMLAPSGLSYSMNGNSVMVSNPRGAPAVITGYPQQQMMQPQPMMQQQAMMAPPPSAPPAYIPAPPPAPPAYDNSMPPPYQPGAVYGAPPMPQQQAMLQPQPQAYAPPPPSPYDTTQAPMMPMQVMPPPSPEMGPPPGAAGNPQQASAAAQPLQIQNPALFQSQTWEAKPGQTLRTILQDWCGRVGAELNWQAEYDYPVMGSLNMTGTFEEAVRTLLAGFNTAKPVPYGRLHYNPAAGQSILIVEASGNHYGD